MLIFVSALITVVIIGIVVIWYLQLKNSKNNFDMLSTLLNSKPRGLWFNKTIEGNWKNRKIVCNMNSAVEEGGITEIYTVTEKGKKEFLSISKSITQNTYYYQKKIFYKIPTNGSSNFNVFNKQVTSKDIDEDTWKNILDELIEAVELFEKDPDKYLAQN